MNGKKAKVMELEFIKDVTNVQFPYSKGDRKKYSPWSFEWQGMTEPERVKKGIFVSCLGMGEFEVFREGIDVKIVKGNKMNGKKAKEQRKEPKVMVDIRIQVLDTGEIMINGPKLEIFLEVITQARRIMIENDAQKQKVVELQKKKLILLN